MARKAIKVREEDRPLIKLLMEIEAGNKEIQTAEQCFCGDYSENSGELDVYQAILPAISDAINQSGLSRAQVVDCLNELMGRKTSEHMLNNYLAPGKPEAKLPLDIFHAICLATGSSGPIDALARLHGQRLVDELEHEYIVLGRLVEQRGNTAKAITVQRQIIAGLKKREEQEINQ